MLEKKCGSDLSEKAAQRGACIILTAIRVPEKGIELVKCAAKRRLALRRRNGALAATICAWSGNV